LFLFGFLSESVLQGKDDVKCAIVRTTYLHSPETRAAFLANMAHRVQKLEAASLDADTVLRTAYLH
jgi:hypothetical protein